MVYSYADDHDEEDGFQMSGAIAEALAQSSPSALTADGPSESKVVTKKPVVPTPAKKTPLKVTPIVVKNNKVVKPTVSALIKKAKGV